MSFDANGGRTGMVRCFQYRSEFFFNCLPRKASVLILVGNGMGGISEGHLIGVVPSSGSVLFENELSDIFPCTRMLYLMCCCCN